MPDSPRDPSDLRRYFARDLRWGEGIQQDLVFDFLCRAADAARGGVLLDAGAGHQRYRPFFAESLYIAQEHPVAGVANKGLCDYDILSDVRCIPLQDASVDVVLSTSSLEHIEFPEAFFREAMRVLRPGGSLCIHVPFVYPEHETPYDFQRPTRYGLERWYRQAGFAEHDVRPASSSIYAITSFVKTAMFEGVRNPARLHAVERVRALLDPGLLGRGALYLLLVWPVLKVLNLLFDRPPSTQTVLPIGWIATARKPGASAIAPRYASSTDFLASRLLQDSGFALRDGAIQPVDGAHAA